MNRHMTIVLVWWKYLYRTDNYLAIDLLYMCKNIKEIISIDYKEILL